MSQPLITRSVHSQRMLSARRWFLLTVTAILVLAGLIAALQFPTTRRAAPVLPAASALTVDVVLPHFERWSKSIDASGAITPWEEASIRSLVTGVRIEEVNADVGSVVKRGQILARFDTTMLKAAAAQSAAALEQAKASALQAHTNEARALQMSESGGISKQDLLQYRTTAEVTRAQEDAARAQHRARLIDLQNTRIVAPDDGTVSARSATLGSVAPVGQELFRLIRQDRLRWQAEVTAAQLSSIRVGMHVVLQLPDNTQVEGAVSQIAPALDAQSRVGIVYVELAPGSHARSGMYASGRIFYANSSAIVVPASAIAMHDGRAHAAVVIAQHGAQQVTLREVTTGRRQGTAVEILGGITNADRVVASGAALLNEGDVVTIASGRRP